jgi:hypothetical protein
MPPTMARKPAQGRRPNAEIMTSLSNPPQNTARPRVPATGTRPGGVGVSVSTPSVAAASPPSSPLWKQLADMGIAGTGSAAGNRAALVAAQANTLSRGPALAPPGSRGDDGSTVTSQPSAPGLDLGGAAVRSGGPFLDPGPTRSISLPMSVAPPSEPFDDWDTPPPPDEQVAGMAGATPPSTATKPWVNPPALQDEGTLTPAAKAPVPGAGAAAPPVFSASNPGVRERMRQLLMRPKGPTAVDPAAGALPQPLPQRQFAGGGVRAGQPLQIAGMGR